MSININRPALIVLLMFVVLDILTGIIKAILAGNLQSSVMRQGLLKKILEIIIVIVGFGVDTIAGLDSIGNACIIFFCAMEGISILENAGEYAPVPEFLREILQSLKDGDKDDD